MKNHVFFLVVVKMNGKLFIAFYTYTTQNIHLYIHKYNSIWPPRTLSHITPYLPFKHTMKASILFLSWREDRECEGFDSFLGLILYLGHLHITLILNVLKYKIKVKKFPHSPFETPHTLTTISHFHRIFSSPLFFFVVVK